MRTDKATLMETSRFSMNTGKAVDPQIIVTDFR